MATDPISRAEQALWRARESLRSLKSGDMASRLPELFAWLAEEALRLRLLPPSPAEQELATLREELNVALQVQSEVARERDTALEQRNEAQHRAREMERQRDQVAARWEEEGTHRRRLTELLQPHPAAEQATQAAQREQVLALQQEIEALRSERDQSRQRADGLQRDLTGWRASAEAAWAYVADLVQEDAPLFWLEVALGRGLMSLETWAGEAWGAFPTEGFPEEGPLLIAPDKATLEVALRCMAEGDEIGCDLVMMRVGIAGAFDNDAAAAEPAPEPRAEPRGQAALVALVAQLRDRVGALEHMGNVGLLALAAAEKRIATGEWMAAAGKAACGLLVCWPQEVAERLEDLYGELYLQQGIAAAALDELGQVTATKSRRRS